MRKILNSFLPLIIVCFAFSACEKSGIKHAEQNSFLSSMANREAVKASLTNYFQSNNNNTARSPRFIAPFFSNEGWGIFDFTNGQLALFSAELSGSDFYRENNDGTVSVHINSNTALAEYLDFNSGAYLSGTPAHFKANYTGPVVEIIISPEFTFKFVDTQASSRAVTISGNGRVQENGTGPVYNLVMKILQSPGGKVSSVFSLN